MPGTSTSSQSLAPSPYNVGNGAVTSSDGRCNQVDSTHMMQNTKPIEWNALPPQSVATVPVSTNSVSSEYYVTSSNNVNSISNHVVYNPPTYMNITYQRDTVPNGYANFNPGRGVNLQGINGSNSQRTPNGQIIGGQVWPNQSPLGKFIPQPPGWVSNKPSSGAKKQKRIRTAFTCQQMLGLEQEYARTHYLDRARRLELAETLKLNERTIKIWFQNRRMKEKKDKIDSMEDLKEINISESSPEMENVQISFHEQYPVIRNEINSQAEVYNPGNIYIENYPAVSAPVAMPPTSLPPSTSIQNSTQSLPPATPVQNAVQNMYETFMSREEWQAEYQQAQLQAQPYNSSHSEDQVPEAKPTEEIPLPNIPSENIENILDYSWIRLLQSQE